MSAIEIRNGIIAGLVMLAVAGALALTGALQGKNMKKVAATYSTAQARVTHRRSTSAYGDDNPALGDSNTKFKYDLDYTVDGADYKIKRTGTWNLSEGFTTVYYNPSNPQKAYSAEQVLGSNHQGWFVFAGIMGGLAIAVIIFVLTQINRPAT